MGSSDGGEGFRSLAAQLRSWPDDRLAHLLLARPDLATPAPHDFGQLASRATVRASLSRALDALTARELSELHALVTASQTTDVEPDQRSEATRTLVDRALVWESETGLRPITGLAEVLAERGPLPADPDEAPEIATSERDGALVDRAGAGAAFDAVRRIEVLLEQWSASPPVMLRSGGLAVRDFKAAVKLLMVEERTAALLVELARESGLVASRADAAGEVVWVPTDAFDTWTREASAQRWERLARAWLRSLRQPGLVGTKDPAGKTWNALDPQLRSPAVGDARHWALRALSTLPPGRVLSAGTGLPSLLAWVRWHRPRRPESHTRLVAAAVEEASALGLVGLDALTSFGRALLADDDAVAALEPLLPEPVDHVLIQADLTAVAPGPLEAALARQLQLVADVESRGGATVYRFTPASLRRALDLGWTSAELHGFVTSVSRTPVPQPLTYLIDDTVRTFGVIRVGHAEAFVRADDEAALSELLHHPKAAGLGLRRLAPTVLVSTTPIDVLLPRLRELGAAPAVEGPDGTIAVARPAPLRARTPQAPAPSGAAAARDTARIGRVVHAVRAGDRAAEQRPARDRRLSPADAVLALREAIAAEVDTEVGYVDNHGMTTRRLVTPRRIEGGMLVGYDHQAQDERGFAVHRIFSVTPSPSSPGNGVGGPG